LVVKSLVTSQQVEALRNNRIDAGFVTLPVDAEGLVVETILSERLVVAFPKRHPLSHRKQVALRALSGETMIVFPLHMSPGRYQLITGMCLRAGISLSVLHEVDNLYTMLELVASGFGVCLMRASVQGMAQRGVVFRELLHSPSVETAIAYRRENNSEVIQQLAETAKRTATT
jgi:DNA-binding transcriptional LysR family regulator